MSNKFKIIIIIFTFITVINNLFADEITTNSLNKEQEIIYLKDIPNNRFTDYAKIQILDKIMAKSTELDIKISENYSFNNLSIMIHKCWKSKPEEATENKSLITVKEYKKSNNKEDVIFNGWILSSSPSISSMEHIIYDITLIKCFQKNDN
jgi:hypothetical protein